MPWVLDSFAAGSLHFLACVRGTDRSQAKESETSEAAALVRDVAGDYNPTCSNKQARD